MTFFIYFIVIAIFALSMFVLVKKYNKINLWHYSKLAKRAIARRQYDNGNSPEFCSYAILQTVKILKKRRKKELMELLLDGKTDKIETFLKKKNKKNLANQINILWQPENIEKNSNEEYWNAVQMYVDAKEMIKEADMEQGSKMCETALKIFNKQNCAIEEMKVYSLLGLMYKSCGIFEMAEAMFETAIQIAKEEQYTYGIVENITNLGMLKSAQKQFEKAEELYNNAIKEDYKNRVTPCVLNQKALNMLLEKKYEKAEETINENLKATKDNASKALAYDILASIMLETKRFKEALDYAEKAEKLYKDDNNFSACLEAKFTSATALYNLEEYEQAEQILRDIINDEKKQASSFHLANVYAMLSSIFVTRQDFQRAKSLLLESLRLEQKNERDCGIFTDCYNMANIEKCLGNNEEAIKYLKKAITTNEALNKDKKKEIEEMIIDLSQKETGVENLCCALEP